MAEQPRREWYLCQTRVKRFLVASDESPRAGAAGFLLVLDSGLPTETRLGHVVDIPSGLYDQWRPDGWHIAQLEMLMVLAALTVFHGQLWMIDNVAALMALIRGKSDTVDLDHLGMLTHAALFGLQVQTYFDWVQSHSNWSDGISRRGFDDTWARRHQFQLTRSVFPIFLWHLPLRGCIRVFEFL